MKRPPSHPASRVQLVSEPRPSRPLFVPPPPLNPDADHARLLHSSRLWGHCMSEINSRPVQPALDRRSVLEMAGGAAAVMGLSTAASAAERISDIVPMDAHPLANAIASRKLSCVR